QPKWGGIGTAEYLWRPEMYRANLFPLHTKILILDHGSQYTQLLARRVRKLDVFCEIHPFTAADRFADDPSVKGVILSGSPASVFDNGAPDTQLGGLQGKVPLLGVCYGAQLVA